MGEGRFDGAWVHRLVRVHEAGHAVACMVLDFPWVDIKIMYRNKAKLLGISGVVHTEKVSPAVRKMSEYADKDLVVTYAGMVAESQWLLQHEGMAKNQAWARSQVDSKSGDLMIIRELLRHSSMSRGAGKAEAFRVIRSKWRMVLRVAQALEKRDHMTAAQATAVARGR